MSVKICFRICSISVIDIRSTIYPSIIQNSFSGFKHYYKNKQTHKTYSYPQLHISQIQRRVILLGFLRKIVNSLTHTLLHWRLSRTGVPFPRQLLLTASWWRRSVTYYVWRVRRHNAHSRFLDWRKHVSICCHFSCWGYQSLFKEEKRWIFDEEFDDIIYVCGECSVCLAVCQSVEWTLFWKLVLNEWMWDIQVTKSSISQ